MSEPSDIVVTGLGLLSPLGIGADETRAAWREGESALTRAAHPATPARTALPWVSAVPDFRVADFLPTPKNYLDRNSELLLAACSLALADAGLAPGACRPERIGLGVGTAWGGLDTMAAFFDDYVRKGPRLVKPMLFPHTYANAAISLAAMEWELRGPHLNFASGRVASAQALVAALDALRADEADVMLAGGCEALGDNRLRLLDALGLLASGPARPAPFAAGPATVAAAECGVMLVLERADRAQARGARPQARVRGAAQCGGAPERLATAAEAALRQALAEAGRSVGEIAWVCLSAAGRTTLDAAEAQAVQACGLSGAAQMLVPAALCGDTEGASGALQTALMLLNLCPPGATGAAGEDAALVLVTDPAGQAVALCLEAMG